MKRKLAVATATVFSLAFPTAIANATPSPTTGVELGVASKDFAYTQVTYDPAAGRTERYKALRDLRAEAWDENIPFVGYTEFGVDHFPAGTRLQDVARHYGVTRSEYLNFKMDENLNWIAIQRAIEATSHFAHVRPNGGSTKGATRNGVAPYLESLSSGSRQSTRTAVLQSLGRTRSPC